MRRILRRFQFTYPNYQSVLTRKYTDWSSDTQPPCRRTCWSLMTAPDTLWRRIVRYICYCNRDVTVTSRHPFLLSPFASHPLCNKPRLASFPDYVSHIQLSIIYWRYDTSPDSYPHTLPDTGSAHSCFVYAITTNNTFHLVVSAYISTESHLL